MYGQLDLNKGLKATGVKTVISAHGAGTTSKPYAKE